MKKSIVVCTYKYAKDKAVINLKVMVKEGDMVGTAKLTYGCFDIQTVNCHSLR